MKPWVLVVLLVCSAARVGADADGQKLKAQVSTNLKAMVNLKVPAKYRGPLALALPLRVRIAAFKLSAAGVTMSGEADSLDDVAEFMRGLNNVVVTSRGLGRVVERKRDANIRVQLLQTGAILEFVPTEVQFPFVGLELKSTGAGPPVAFELAVAAP
jgi:type IV pilus assembly protein PilN